MTHPPYEPYPVSTHPSYPPPSDRDQQVSPSKTQAGWALGLACVPSVITWIIAVVLACLVISRSKDGRDHGKGMAVAALYIMVAWVIVAVLVGAVFLTSRAERDDRGRVTDGGRSTISGLHVGDCLPAPEANDEEQLTVQVVTCAEPHNAEVYANFDLKGEWTTVVDVDHAGQAGCVEQFSKYVGIPPRKSSLEVLYLVPISESSFKEDNSVACILIAPESLTASLAGSKR